MIVFLPGTPKRHASVGQIRLAMRFIKCVKGGFSHFAEHLGGFDIFIKTWEMYKIGVGGVGWGGWGGGGPRFDETLIIGGGTPPYQRHIKLGALY